jgi:hypothetical protein
MSEQIDKEENTDIKITNEGNDYNESSFIKDNKFNLSQTSDTKSVFSLFKLNKNLELSNSETTDSDFIWEINNKSSKSSKSSKSINDNLLPNSETTDTDFICEINNKSSKSINNNLLSNLQTTDSDFIWKKINKSNKSSKSSKSNNILLEKNNLSISIDNKNNIKILLK